METRCFLIETMHWRVEVFLRDFRRIKDGPEMRERREGNRRSRDLC